MNNKLRLKDIIINKENNLIEAIISLIDHKILNEDLEMEDALRETLEFLQMLVPIYQVSADRKSSRCETPFTRQKFRLLPSSY